MSTPAELVDELRRRVQAALDAGRAARFTNGDTDGDDDLTAALANLAETLGPDDPVVVAVARALLAVPALSGAAGEHLAWAIGRALADVDAGLVPGGAMRSLITDLDLHEETQGILGPWTLLAMVAEYQRSGVEGLRGFITDVVGGKVT